MVPLVGSHLPEAAGCKSQVPSRKAGSSHKSQVVFPRVQVTSHRVVFLPGQVRSREGIDCMRFRIAIAAKLESALVMPPLLCGTLSALIRGGTRDRRRDGNMLLVTRQECCDVARMMDGCILLRSASTGVWIYGPDPLGMDVQYSQTPSFIPLQSREGLTGSHTVGAATSPYSSV